MSDQWRITLSDLNFGPEEEAAVLRVMKSRWLSMGPEVREFESEFSRFLGVRHAVAVANATAGLHLAYLALGIGQGEEIIQPALNFVAAANMSVAVGATPVFADIISLEEPTIDPAHVEKLISPRTRAVVAMHYGGYLCRMVELLEICQRHGVALIEDACHAVGAEFETGRGPARRSMAGGLGDVAAFSFFSNKNLATGEGGMVVTNRDDVADALHRLRSHGMTTLTWERHRGHASSYDVTTSGYNYRLDDLHAAIGREQLKKLRDGNQRRQLLTRYYIEQLSTLPEWIVPFSAYKDGSANHLMAVLAPDTGTRARVVNYLRDARIQTSLHYPCVTKFSAFAGRVKETLPCSSAFSERVITLPLHPSLTESSIEEICERIRTVVSSAQ